MVFSGSLTARLVALEGPTKGEFLIGPGLTIGRSSKCQVVVMDAQVSTQHAWVGPQEGFIVVRDLGSTNGTFLNDDLTSAIHEAALQGGDTITLGMARSVKFKLVL